MMVCPLCGVYTYLIEAHYKKHHRRMPVGGEATDA